MEIPDASWTFVFQCNIIIYLLSLQLLHKLQQHKSRLRIPFAYRKPGQALVCGFFLRFGVEFASIQLRFQHPFPSQDSTIQTPKLPVFPQNTPISKHPYASDAMLGYQGISSSSSSHVRGRTP